MTQITGHILQIGIQNYTHIIQNIMEKGGFYDILKIKIHKFILTIYKDTEKFPKSEIYGCTNQLRRAAVSIILNYLEGFARFKPKVKLNFFEISHGSIKECKYLIFLALEMGWINQNDYKKSFSLIDEISAMIYTIISGLQKQNN